MSVRETTPREEPVAVPKRVPRKQPQPQREPVPSPIPVLPVLPEREKVPVTTGR